MAPGGQLSPGAGTGKDKQICRERSALWKSFFFFLLRQGLACLSLLSDGVTGTGRHAWFTHMILNRLKTKQNEVEIGEFLL